MPGADLAIYAIWFNMLGSDAEAKWPRRLLTDPRVKHYWDAQKVVGTFYGENVSAGSPQHVEWDAYFLYGPEAEWIEEVPSGLVSWGRTIVGSRDHLENDLLRVLGSADE